MDLVSRSPVAVDVLVKGNEAHRLDQGIAGGPFWVSECLVDGDHGLTS